MKKKNTPAPIKNPAILPIEAAAQHYANARAALADRVNAFEIAQRTLLAQWLPIIKERAAKAADKQAGLKALIEAHPALFVEPRTLTIHGIKFGFQKGKGQIEWDDADKVVERLRAHFTKQQVEAFLDVKTTPRKSALLCVEAGTLKKLGCTLTGTDDQVVIKASDSEVDKLVARLLEEGSQKKE